MPKRPEIKKGLRFTDHNMFTNWQSSQQPKKTHNLSPQKTLLSPQALRITAATRKEASKQASKQPTNQPTNQQHLHHLHQSTINPIIPRYPFTEAKKSCKRNFRGTFSFRPRFAGDGSIRKGWENANPGSLYYQPKLQGTILGEKGQSTISTTFCIVWSTLKI